MPAVSSKGPKRLKVLVSCFACNPTKGSEPGMGANWVLQLARHHELWVLTDATEQCDIALADYLEQHCPELKSSIHIIGIPHQRFRLGEKLWEPFFYYWTYRSWQWNAYREAQRLLQQIDFDLAHQLNMIGYREPGYLWKLPAAFIWGPIGGHAQMPWRFLSSLGFRGAIHYGVRNILNWIQMRTSVRVRSAIRRADVLVAATHVDAHSIRNIHQRNAVLLNEQGAVHSAKTPRTQEQAVARPLRVVWCGRFIALKALPLGLKAVHRARSQARLEFHVIGDGNCAMRWKQIASDQGLDDICYWHGQLPHSDVLNVMATCDVMLFTSLQEGTPAVVLEAIQLALPVVCHDSCGFGAVVDETCGIKVPVFNSQQSIEGFANALVRLNNEVGLVQRLAKGAIRRAQELSWERKAQDMLALYREAINCHNENVPRILAEKSPESFSGAIKSARKS